MKKNILITVCGRAGSKGLKNKNLKTFIGFPLVYYTLSAAELFIKQAKNIVNVDVCLNTDSDDLAKIVAEKYPNVFFIKRSMELAGGEVPKPAVWKNCVEVMQKKRSITYDYMIDLDITSPLRQENDVYDAFQTKLKRPDADLVESMCSARRNPYFNMKVVDGDFVKTVVESGFVARQQAPMVYDENASIYVLRAGYLVDGYVNSKPKTIPYIMKDTAVLDIDSEEDFLMMEVVGKYLYENVVSYSVIRDNIRK